MSKEIRIGVQKYGNLAKDSLRTLRNAGLVFAGPESGLIASCEDVPAQVCFERIGYIPPYVEEGTFDLGIVGRDQLEEESRQVDIIASLDFGQCAICVMGPPEIDFSPELLEGKRIATSRPQIVRRYLEKIGIGAVIVSKAGNTESMTALGKADFIADIVNTGRTAESCGLKVYRDQGTIFQSEAVLITNQSRKRTKTMNILIESIKRGVEINRRCLLVQWALRQCQKRKLEALLARRE